MFVVLKKLKVHFSTDSNISNSSPSLPYIILYLMPELLPWPALKVEIVRPYGIPSWILASLIYDCLHYVMPVARDGM